MSMIDIEITMPDGIYKGDRVRYTSELDTNLMGKEGTALSSWISGKKYSDVLVEFDEPIRAGHNGNSSVVRGKDGHCWWCQTSTLEVI